MWFAPAAQAAVPVRTCTAPELRAPWPGAAVPRGAVLTYRLPSGTVIATRIEGRSSDILTTSQPTGYDPALGARNFASPLNRQRDLYGFLPVEMGSAGTASHRRMRYTAAVGQVWSAPPGRIVSGVMEETSDLDGIRRVIHGPFRTRLLGCADLPVRGVREAAKVYRLLLTMRQRNARVRPVVEGFYTLDARYYIGLRSGMILAVDYGSGPIPVANVAVPRAR